MRLLSVAAAIVVALPAMARQTSPPCGYSIPLIDLSADASRRVIEGEAPYIASVRLKLPELDAKAKEGRAGK